jgi:hypothetical protein
VRPLPYRGSGWPYAGYDLHPAKGACGGPDVFGSRQDNALAIATGLSIGATGVLHTSRWLLSLRSATIFLK